MKALVVFDSQYGNTEQVAQAIGKALGCVAVRVRDAGAADLRGVDLLVVGSPTQGGRPTAALKAWLDGLRAGALEGVGVAAFDTRILPEGRNLLMRLLLTTVGRAAPRILASLRAKGGRAVAEPEGFAVEGKEGPLRAGEVERAASWARGRLGAPQPARREA